MLSVKITVKDYYATEATGVRCLPGIIGITSSRRESFERKSNALNKECVLYTMYCWLFGEHVLPSIFSLKPMAQSQVGAVWLIESIWKHNCSQ